MRFRLPAFFALLMLAAACAPAGTPAPSSTPQTSGSALAAAFPVTLTDFQNRPVTLPTRPERIVSIGPSITEFLFALGAGPRVVGADDFSDEPAAAKQLEKVGGIKVNFEKVVSLRPDLVLSVKFSDGTIEKLASAGLLVLMVLAAAAYSAKPGQVAARTGWSVISAVRNKRIVTIAPNLINRPGPRVGEAAEAYAKLVHPELFP